jgi:hypothetical protein
MEINKKRHLHYTAVISLFFFAVVLTAARALGSADDPAAKKSLPLAPVDISKAGGTLRWAQIQQGQAAVVVSNAGTDAQSVAVTPTPFYYCRESGAGL